MMRRQQGIALVLVMWVSVLLTVIASSFIVERRTEQLIVHNSASLARAEAAANSGVMRGVIELYRVDTSPDRWTKNGEAHDWAFDGMPVRISVRDESAKIDINTASDQLLRGLLVSAGLKDDEATRLLDAILDWRDPDSLKRPQGAEEADYRSAGLTYVPANAPFQAIEELQLVLGMRPDIYRRIAPSITVFSRQPGINPQVASRDVLLAIPGIAPEVVDQYIADRERAIADKQPIPPLPPAVPYTTGTSMIATIRAEAHAEDGVTFAREAAVVLRPVPRRPVTFISWRDITSGEPDPLASAQPQPTAPAPARS